MWWISVTLVEIHVSVCTLFGVEWSQFRLVGAFKTKKRPQKRVFREKLTLDVFSGHKPTQTRLVQLHIVSCRNVQLTRADQQNLANKSTFLDGQTLNQFETTTCKVWPIPECDRFGITFGVTFRTTFGSTFGPLFGPLLDHFFRISIFLCFQFFMFFL